MVFQIQKQFKALLNQAFGQAAASGGKQFFADFKLAQCGIELAHKVQGFIGTGKIKRHNHRRALYRLAAIKD